MANKIRVNVSIDIDLLEQLDQYARQEYYGNRSMAVAKLVERQLQNFGRCPK